MEKKYYLGLDIGTDSVGYGVTDQNYKLLKFHGKDAWGVTLFDEAELNDARRAFRTSRRRLDRRQQRVLLIQELFADEIEKVDSRFFIRLMESRLFREEADAEYILFNDPDYTDKDYFAQYPTIHHLIVELMHNAEPHDVRLVYLACAWLVAHRGHFLSNIDKNNIEKVRDYNIVYEAFMNFFKEKALAAPWGEIDRKILGKILCSKTTITAKKRELAALLYPGEKPAKEATEDFGYSCDAIIGLLAGGSVSVKDLFCNDIYTEAGSLSLGMDEEKFLELASVLGEDFDIVEVLRTLYDWAVLVDVLGDKDTISEAIVGEYEQHKNDLAFLKKVIKKYKPEQYDEVFRKAGICNYAAYSCHGDSSINKSLKKCSLDDFSKYILGIIKTINPDEEDVLMFTDMKERLNLRTFLPKQKNTDNRVIPHQLYWYELKKILKNASCYLSFLNKIDQDGISTADKIESVFLFRIPYFVGPLNSHSSYSWIVRKAGKIYPWNFEKMVDLDASEQAFIERLTNTCTYLPGETVLPKDSLCYCRFMVLNELNNLRINGERISVDLKQKIFNDLFLNDKRVTRKKLTNYLLSNGVIEKGEEDSISGIDIEIKANLAPLISFRRLLKSGVITENDAERIIERSAYAEDKSRLLKWLEREYSVLSEEDRRYLAGLRFKNFGRLSMRFLNEMECPDPETGELMTILQALWSTQNNLMELLSDKYLFGKRINEIREEYFACHKRTLEERLDEMYVSNAVRRPIYRTLDIVKDVVKAFGVPEKIFVEMARGGKEDQKGRRTKSRKQQILELYDKCEEDVRVLRQQLEAMGEAANSKLQGDKLFLYYMQLGRCMYSGEPIELEKLGTKQYDIDHIYPQAFIKDDSIINNRVLVLSSINGDKGDRYPLNSKIRQKMQGFWDHLKNIGLIGEEKYKRLTRGTAFTDEEKYGFINRQLTETTQSTKAVAELLKEKYSGTEIVYVKAKLTSEFRQEFDLYKSRSFNDLHHAVDAYLNIVNGNVYNMKFSKRWFDIHSPYSVKTKTLFTHPLVCGGTTVWDGENMLKQVKRTAVKNTAHLTKYAFLKTGGLFDQMPVKAADGLIPLKKDLPTEKYGGYNKSSVMFYIPTKYKAGRKTAIIILSVEMTEGRKFLADEAFAKDYAAQRLSRILRKSVDEVSFPMGMRPWKVNTMLSLDGFRVCITGISSYGKCLSIQPMMPFSEDAFWQYYMKKLDVLSDKILKNPHYVYDPEYDKVSAERNEQLYDIYIEKLEHTIYQKRNASPIEVLKEGKEMFKALDIFQQVNCLINLQQVFGRLTGGCDLTMIGGSKKTAATVSFSSNIANWKKNYSDVRIIDSSASGLWEKVSENLLELI